MEGPYVQKARDWLKFIHEDSYMCEGIASAETTCFRDLNYEATVSALWGVVRNVGGQYNTEHKVLDVDIETCVSEYSSNNICILNFADYTKPGGLFLEGKMAQEEAVCHFTGAFPILDKYAIDFYLRNETLKLSGKYAHSFIVATGVPYTVNGRYGKLNMVSCAAPNFRYILKSGKVEEITDFQKAMQERQELAYLIAATTGSNIFIAGAWGCGVFKNDPNIVAKGWKKCTTKYQGVFTEVVHPIPGDNSLNRRVFDRILR